MSKELIEKLITYIEDNEVYLDVDELRDVYDNLATVKTYIDILEERKEKS